MHKLDRTITSKPDCLDNYNYNYQTQTWDDFGNPCKSELRLALAKMQGNPVFVEHEEYSLCCAYCECEIFHGGHIEHFRRKSSNHPNGYPELTFEWSNLFLACGSHEHCGHYKDHRKSLPYNPDELIKPDVDNPDDYLFFSSTGAVRVKSGLDEFKSKKASETIRVFNLEHPALNGQRARALSGYKKLILDDLAEIESWDESDRRSYLQGEIDATQWHPFSTTIKHYLISSY